MKLYPSYDTYANTYIILFIKDKKAKRAAEIFSSRKKYFSYKIQFSLNIVILRKFSILNSICRAEWGKLRIPNEKVK